MSEIRINAEHLNEFIGLVAHCGTHKQSNKFWNKLFELIDFEMDELSQDFHRKAMFYLSAEHGYNPERSDHRGAWDTEKGDPLPDDLKEPTPTPTPAPGPSPNSAFGLEPLDKTDPISIWRYTRRNLLITEHIATFILNSGWDYIDRRRIDKPLTKPDYEVNSILIEQQIEERYIKDCDPKFVGLMELIFKAFHHWWLEDQKRKSAA